MKRILIVAACLASLMLGAETSEHHRAIKNRTKMEYPPLALNSGTAGSVIFDVPVGADGRVEIDKVTTRSENKLLVDPCKENLKTWEFGPGPAFVAKQIMFMFRFTKPGESEQNIFFDESLTTSLIRNQPLVHADH